MYTPSQRLSVGSHGTVLPHPGHACHARVQQNFEKLLDGTLKYVPPGWRVCDF